MPRLSPDEKIAAIEQKLADNSAAQTKLKRDLRKERSKQNRQTQKQRAHAAIVLGLNMAEHAIRNPSSEVRRVAIRILENDLAQKPKGDAPVADLLERLRTASHARDTAKLMGEAPIETDAESISDAVEAAE